MSLVEYSINGKYFRDFGVYVSSSSGLGEPKPKDRTVFDWKEYNGVFSDLEQKPKYQPREIEIKGFAKGENFEAVLRNIKTLFSEFKKAGKQRLLIEAQGQSALVYDVVLVGEVDPDRVYNDDEIFATYTAKLVEYSPIKKILKLDSNVLDLKFNTPKWVEVNIDGKIYPKKGAVNINQIVDARTLTNLSFSSRNFLAKSNLELGAYSVSDGSKISSTKYIRTKNNIAINPSSQYRLKFFSNNIGKWFATVLFFDKNGWYIGFETFENDSTFGTPENAKYINVNIFDFPENTKELDINWFNQYINVMLINGVAINNWTSAPEDQHFITIAGNVDEITNLTTNAVEIWRD